MRVTKLIDLLRSDRIAV